MEDGARRRGRWAAVLVAGTASGLLVTAAAFAAVAWVVLNP